jgi:Mn-dependent DtxR family transcriptional regulator
MNTPTPTAANAPTSTSQTLLKTALQNLRQDFEAQLKQLSKKLEQQNRDLERMVQELRREGMLKGAGR